MVKTTSVLTTKIRREIGKNFLQYLAIIFITALAVTLFSGLSSNYISFQNRVNECYDEGNVADIWTQVTTPRIPDVSQINKCSGEGAVTEERFVLPSYVQKSSVNGIVSDVMPTINKPFTISDGGVGEDGSFFLMEEKTYDRIHQNNPDVVIGSAATVSIATVTFKSAFSTYIDYIFHMTMDEFVTYLDSHIKTGGTNILSGEFIDTKVILTGTMTHPENLENGSFFSSYYLMNTDTFSSQLLNVFDSNYDETVMSNLRMLFSSSNFVNQYVTTVGDGVSAAQAKSAINDYFEEYGGKRLVTCMDRTGVPSFATISNDIVQAQQLSYAFPLIFFIVAVLIVLTTISQIIFKERTIIGTMKAIGLSKTQIYSHYMSLTTAVCSIGTIIGIIVGPLLLPKVMDLKYKILYSIPSATYVFPYAEFFISTIVLLAVGCLVTFLACYKDVSLTPAQSMRPRAVKMKEAKTIRKKDGKRFFFSWRMCLRNIRNNLVNSIMVLIGVAGCTSLLVCGFGIEDTLQKGVSNDMAVFYNSDGLVSYVTGVGTGENELKTIDGLTDAEDYSMAPTQVTYNDKDYSTYVYALKENHHYFTVQFDINEVAISQKIAKEQGLSVGSEFTFTVLGVSYNAKVGTIFEAFYVHGVYLSYDNPNYANLGKTKSNAWIDYDSDKETEVLEKINDLPIVSKAQTKAQLQSQITGILSNVSMMTNTIKVFAILLAVIVLYNLAILNYRQRIRDIATLKVLGFTKFEISRSLIFESMSLSSVGVIGGLFLGLPMEYLVLMTNETPVVSFLFYITGLTYIIAAIITLGTSLLVNMYLSNMTNKIPMVESLKSIE